MSTVLVSNVSSVFILLIFHSQLCHVSSLLQDKQGWPPNLCLLRLFVVSIFHMNLCGYKQGNVGTVSVPRNLVSF